MAKVIPVEFPAILDRFFTSVAISRILKRGWGMAGQERDRLQNGQEW